MKYNKGDRVRHPKRDDWGLGEVLAGSDGGAVRIFFVEAGEKTISLDIIEPVPVTGPEAADPVLDNLKTDKPASGIKYRSLAESIQFFLGSTRKDSTGTNTKRRSGIISWMRTSWRGTY